MFKSTIIGLVGKGGQGKSSTIKFFIEKIRRHFPIHEENLLIDNGDIKTIFNIKGVKIGIESQGDPDSRQPYSIDEFVNLSCNIIVVACRTSGETYKAVQETKENGYRVLLVTNLRSKQIDGDILNKYSAEQILNILIEIIDGDM